MTSRGEIHKCDEVMNEQRRIAANGLGQSSQMVVEEAETTSSTTILQLNCDCLMEVCQRMTSNDLCAFADVCHQFKQIARAYFTSSKLKHETHNVYRLVTSLRILRNFGWLISSLETTCSNRDNDFLIEMLLRFCGDSLNALTLKYFHLDGISAETMRPLLLRLQKIGIIECRCSYSFLYTLFCLPELLEMGLKTETRNDCRFIRNLPKLESFSMGYLNCDQFKAFIEKNQQLKTLKLNDNCDRRNFALIAEHLPSIENLCITGAMLTENVHICMLAALKKLKIRNCSCSIDVDINQLAAANIPIETLEIVDCPCNNDLMIAISKLKMVKMLRMEDENCSLPSNMFEMYASLGELTELHLKFRNILFDDDLLSILRCARKLEKVTIRRCYSVFSGRLYLYIDAVTYVKIAEIVRSRSEGSQHLEIIFQHRLYTIDVPIELRKAYSHLLRIKSTDFWEIKKFRPVLSSCVITITKPIKVDECSRCQFYLFLFIYYPYRNTLNFISNAISYDHRRWIISIIFDQLSSALVQQSLNARSQSYFWTLITAIAICSCKIFSQR